jgi:hypothetical protein
VRQNSLIWISRNVIGINSTPVQIGGAARVLISFPFTHRDGDAAGSLQPAPADLVGRVACGFEMAHGVLDGGVLEVQGRTADPAMPSGQHRFPRPAWVADDRRPAGNVRVQI